MIMNIAINGFGRIGRGFLRAVLSDAQARKKLTVVAINIGSAPPESVAHMFKYDSVLGAFGGDVSYKNKQLVINKHKIALIQQLDPAKINWKKYKIDWVVESSGHFTEVKKARAHIRSGAGHVLITAPAKGAVPTIIPGVNQESYNPKKDTVVSLGSCTTNAFATMLYVLAKHDLVERGFMTTIHAYTNTQVLLDVEHKDLRRARAAALNIIPTSTGAARLIDTLIPSMKGKIDAHAYRVPVATGSLIEFTFTMKKKLSRTALNMLFKKAAASYMKKIVDYAVEPLVSSDYTGNPYSVVIDSQLTCVQATMAQLCGWYDNEWGYCQRLKDFLLFVRTR